MLEIKALTKIFDKGDSFSFTAVDNVNFRIIRGDFICIVGRSGSGKSTMLNMIVGLLRPTSGKVVINGEDLWSMNDKHMAKVRNSMVGYIPQGLSLLSDLTILDNVRLPFFFANRAGNGIEQAMGLLKEIKLQNLVERYPSQLSGGEIRRVMIARSLINRPDILIADEPTGDLDEQTTKEVMELFSEIRSKGITILMITHESDITRYGNRVFNMSSGKLVENTKMV